MADHFAIKRLTASDCTLFEAVFRTIDAGNQKSINLNADVLVGRLYPNLSAAAVATDNAILLAVAIYGPDAKPAHRLTRKIIKNPSYKNWRLNGEFISGPPGDPTRYDNIRPGDLAIMAFKGVTVPNGLDLILVCQAAHADEPVLAALSSLFGSRSMIEVTPAQIGSAIQGAGIPIEHPVHIAVANTELEAALEDAAQGGQAGTDRLLRNSNGRSISSADLAKARTNAERIGREGEGLVNAWLAAEVAAGRLARYTWTAAANAVAPFDFETFSAAGERTLIDAKSTSGPFENTIHISLAEIVAAAGGDPYRIVRVSELTADGGKLRMSDDLGPFARTLKGLHETHIPAGVRVDGFSVATSALTWRPETYVEWPEEEEGGVGTPVAPAVPSPP